jgi:tetratricopeptide (TPR) repeat protein
LEAVGKLNLEDKTTSVKVLSEFISEHPDVGTGYALRASEFGCETSEPNIEMAYADAKRSLEYPPDILNFGNLSTAIVAKASLRLNKPREAITLLTDAISRNLKNPNDLLQSKTGKIEQSEFSLCHWALSDFDAMSTASPNDWRVPLIRGVYYASLVNLTDEALFAKAMGQYRMAAAMNPKSPIPEYLLGEIQSKSALFSMKSIRSAEGKRAENLRAVPAFTNAIRIDPNFTLAYLGRASAYLEAKEPALAVQDFTVVIEREPENASAMADRGNAHVDRHEYYPAITDFGDAIRLKTKTGDSYLSNLYENRGDAYAAVSDISKAIDDYSDAIALTLGRQLQMLTLAQLRSLYPDFSDLSDGAFLHVLHDGFAPDENEEVFDKRMAEVKSPWEVSFLLSDLYQKRGDSYLRLKDYAAALMDFKRIYQGVPNMADSLWSARLFLYQ